MTDSDPQSLDPRSLDPRSRRVVLVVFDRAEPLDLAGPLSVFSQANALIGTRRYDLRVVGPDDSATLEGGLVVATERIESVEGPIDTLVVAGGAGFLDAGADRELALQVQRLAPLSRRVASVCSGAFVLAAAGLLDGRRATTHWSVADMLAEMFPAVTVESDRIYIDDDDRWTSAGITAGIDLALAMVGRDEGPDLAQLVARWLVLPVRRAGGQSQYGPQLAATEVANSSLAPLRSWIADHLDCDLSVAALAERAGWSERHLTRRFIAETGEPPGRWVESLRLDAVRRLLETTDLPVATVATRCGFASREVLHRAFRRRLGTSPDQYRRAFGSAPGHRA